MKKILFVMAAAVVLTGCSKDDEPRIDALTSTAWVYEVTPTLERSWSFGVNQKCHSTFQIKGDKPIIRYYPKYRVNGGNHVDICREDGSVIFTGRFNDSTLIMDKDPSEVFIRIHR